MELGMVADSPTMGMVEQTKEMLGWRSADRADNRNKWTIPCTILPPRTLSTKVSRTNIPGAAHRRPQNQTSAPCRGPERASLAQSQLVYLLRHSSCPLYILTHQSSTISVVFSSAGVSAAKRNLLREWKPSTQLSAFLIAGAHCSLFSSVELRLLRSFWMSDLTSVCDFFFCGDRLRWGGGVEFLRGEGFCFLAASVGRVIDEWFVIFLFSRSLEVRWRCGVVWGFCFLAANGAEFCLLRALNEWLTSVCDFSFVDIVGGGVFLDEEIIGTELRAKI